MDIDVNRVRVGTEEADSLEEVVKAAGEEREGVAEDSARAGRKGGNASTGGSQDEAYESV